MKILRSKTVSCLMTLLCGLLRWCTELEILGDLEEPRKVAVKYLRVVPKRFVPIAISIESVLDTTNMSIEEITGWLRAVEGRADEEDTDPPMGAGGWVQVANCCSLRSNG
jgi:hypothetical protein